MRMLAQTPEIENGHVPLPKYAHRLPDYVQELTTFPKANTTIRSTRPRKH